MPSEKFEIKGLISRLKPIVQVWGSRCFCPAFAHCDAKCEKTQECDFQCTIPHTSALDKKIDGAYMSINENLTEELWDQVSDFEARFF